MFILTQLTDTISIDPRNFPENPNQESLINPLCDQIHKKFCDKVLPSVGLCISLYDFLDIGEPFIYPGDGAAHIKVEFRFVVFRPFVGEILTGTIVDCDESGVYVSIGTLFKDIHIPRHLMQENTIYTYDATTERNLYTWEYQDARETPPTTHHLVMDLFSTIRFRVSAVLFDVAIDHTTPPKAEIPEDPQKVHEKLIKKKQREMMLKQIGDDTTKEGTESMHVDDDDDGDDKKDQDDQEQKGPPMIITGKINEYGLGLSMWWESGDGSEEEEDDDDEDDDEGEEINYDE